MMPRCPHCQSFAFLDWTACGSCGVELGYRYTTLSFLQVHPEGTVADGDTWRTCSNRDWGCNWLVADSEESGRCFSCRLSRRLPDRDDTIAWEKLKDTGIAKRRLLVQLFELGLPVTHLDSHASYIEHWLKLLKEDDRAILTAAAKAEEASTLLLKLGGRVMPEHSDGASDDAALAA